MEYILLTILKRLIRKFFFEKLGSLKKTLSIWSRRDIPIYGRINIVKTLALSKLVFICSVMETPKNFAKEVDKITFDFIWKQKPATIKGSPVGLLWLDYVNKVFV